MYYDQSNCIASSESTPIIKMFSLLKQISKATLLTLPLLYACTPTPNTSAIKDLHPGFMDYDEQLVRMGNQLPGFGGMFYDDNGNLNVYFSGAAWLESNNAPEAAKQRVKTALTAVFNEDLSIRSSASGASTSAGIQFLQGQFSIHELARWRVKVEALMHIQGVVLSDLDEAKNRLKMGVENETVRTQILMALREARIPPGAVAIEIMPPFQQFSTLRDKNRPIQGGNEIDTLGAQEPINSNLQGQVCSTGFIGVLGFTTGFVTASHCTFNRGGVEGTQFYQQGNDPFNESIGYETVDPGYWSSPIASQCPAGRRCRYSDAAFITLNADFAFATPMIRKPDSINTQSITLDSDGLSLVVWDALDAAEVGVNDRATVLVEGTTVEKIGSGSGWTSGRIFETCANTNVAGTDITLKCQYHVLSEDTLNPIATLGDSGAPVFQRLWVADDRTDPLYGKVKLLGTMWGGGNHSCSRDSVFI